MQKGVALTYETLYEVLRREKAREDLQKLDPRFFTDVQAYLQEKLRILEQSRKKSDVFSIAEQEKTRLQIENAKKLLKDLYARREKKIIELALNKARTHSPLIDTSQLLPEESNIFESLLYGLDTAREHILLPLLKQDLTMIKEEKTEQNTKKVKCKQQVQQFVGKELEIYGPYEADEVVQLPNEIADVLIKQGSAEGVE